MFNIICSVVASLIAAVLFVICQYSYYKYLERRPFIKLHKFFPKEPALIVFPGRSDANRKGLLHDKLVTFEDMLAANYIERILTLSKWDDELIQMRESTDFGRIDARDTAKNLVLLCSPRSNIVTKQYLEMINKKKGLNWNFKIKANDQLTIVTDTATWESATYLQEEKLRSENISIEESTLDDIAMVIRTDNPCNSKTKVFIIAGIRGIGTWGAAKYLRQNAKELIEVTKGKDFACLLKVTYDRWRIKKVELSDTMKIFE